LLKIIITITAKIGYGVGNFWGLAVKALNCYHCLEATSFWHGYPTYSSVSDYTATTAKN